MAKYEHLVGMEPGRVVRSDVVRTVLAELDKLGGFFEAPYDKVFKLIQSSGLNWDEVTTVIMNSV